MPYQVHPAAECFRLMNEEELAALAADIAENGQTDPIVLGRVNGGVSEFVIDGRNRLKACEIAKVEPKIETRMFENDDAVRAFVKSRGERRDLTKSEKAMALAMLYPEPGKGGRGKEGAAKQAKKLGGFSDERLRQARLINRHAPELARAVRDGAVRLDDALKRVEDERKALQSEEACMSRLLTEAPDLADLVTEERLKLNEAIRALDTRIAESKRQQETATRVLQSIFNALFPRGATPAEWADRLTGDVNADFWTGADDLSHENLHACAEVMRAISERWKE